MTRAGRAARLAVYPGTFDPVTNGHLDIIERGSRLFDRVVVAILENLDKKPLFSVAERRELIRQAVGRFPNVSVQTFRGLLVDYVRDCGAHVIVRGLRALSDFEYEFQMALMNRRLDPDVETVFMMPSEAYSYLSSRLVKEVAFLGGDVSGLVPPVVAQAIMQRAALGRNP
ncbi:MAG: pantetheine-phosphate adenylyltransferase [Acidobacteriota bacterium]